VSVRGSEFGRSALLQCCSNATSKSDFSSQANLCKREYDEGVECTRAHGFLDLIPSATLSPSTEHFIAVDPRWIDVQRLRRWPVFCDSHHRGSCHSFTSEWQVIDRLPSPLSFLLIDALQNCLVRASGSARYLALSYVWGKLSNVIESTKENVSQLSKPGALCSGALLSQLPATVRDAIYFTKAMGERYLWVDRLCIIQDDDEHKAEQISWMGSIYANSYFTIIAADGPDANYGLRGVGGTSLPRSHELDILHFTPSCSMIPEPRKETQFNKKDWHKRGWTYQERALSNRRIVFFGGTAFWECRRSGWREELVGNPDVRFMANTRDERRDVGYWVVMRRWPDLNHYCNLVLAYNQRLLTFPADGLDAFSAIINTMSRSFPGGFLYGVPEFFFDIGLLWRPSTTIQRRSVKSKDGRTFLFPSWSWVGWEGNIGMSFLCKAHPLLWDQDQLAPPIAISPMVSWNKRCRDTGEPFPISNSYHQFRDIAHDPSADLPPGWSRHRPSEIGTTERSLTYLLGGSSANSKIPEYVFRYKDVDNETFLSPLPIPDRPLAPKANRFTQYLSFRTVQCSLVCQGLLRPPKDGMVYSNKLDKMIPYCLPITLTDQSGEWAGVLDSNISDPDDVVPGQPCELIAISSGVAQHDFLRRARFYMEEWEHAEQIKHKDTYEFINVLWIEWQESIAYRKALGRVWKDAWHRQSRKEVDVLLG
jgi:hypothetical protein